MKRKSFLIIFLLSLSLLNAKDFKVAVFQIPTSDMFVNLFNALGEETNNKFIIQLVPPSRGIYLIENNEVDISFPSTVSLDQKKIPLMKFDYSKARAYKMVFVLYTNKSKKIDIDNLKKGNSMNYQIETSVSLFQMFEFQPLKSTNLEASLKKVNDGLIDGFLYAQDTADPLLKKLGYKNVKRQFYNLNEIAFALQKGTAGGEIDKILLDGIAKLKANGRLNKILDVAIKNSVYSDWQP